MMQAKFNNAFDRWLCSHARGTARINRLLRGLWPIRLIQCEIDYGILLHLDPESYVDRICIDKGFYEKEVLNAIIADIQPDDVFWDIGANIGIMSIAVAKLYPTAQVVAFECSPLTTHRLCANISLNEAVIKVVNLALSDQNRIATLSIRNVGNSGVSSLSPTMRASYENEVSVATLTGDSLIETNDVPPPTHIKIDVEGHELRVLKGLSKHLDSESLRTIVFEANDPESYEELRWLLADKGFVIEAIPPRMTVSPTNFVAKRPKS